MTAFTVTATTKEGDCLELDVEADTMGSAVDLAFAKLREMIPGVQINHGIVAEKEIIPGAPEGHITHEQLVESLRIARDADQGEWSQ